MTLALVRHGRTAWNHERRMQGRTDLPLDDEGRMQALGAGRLLARAQWRRIVSSPLERAHETAQIIGQLAGLEVARDPALIERDYGIAEGLSVSEAHERWPEGDYPSSEPLGVLAERAGAALRARAEETGTIVVAHGTFLRIGIEALTGTTCPRIINGQVVLIERRAGEGYTARIVS